MNDDDDAGDDDDNDDDDDDDDDDDGDDDDDDDDDDDHDDDDAGDDDDHDDDDAGDDDDHDDDDAGDDDDDDDGDDDDDDDGDDDDHDDDDAGDDDDDDDGDDDYLEHWGHAGRGERAEGEGKWTAEATWLGMDCDCPAEDACECAGEGRSPRRNTACPADAAHRTGCGKKTHLIKCHVAAEIITPEHHYTSKNFGTETNSTDATCHGHKGCSKKHRTKWLKT